MTHTFHSSISFLPFIFLLPLFLGSKRRGERRFELGILALWGVDSVDPLVSHILIPKHYKNLIPIILHFSNPPQGMGLINSLHWYLERRVGQIFSAIRGIWLASCDSMIIKVKLRRETRKWFGKASGGRGMSTSFVRWKFIDSKSLESFFFFWRCLYTLPRLWDGAEPDWILIFLWNNMGS